MPTGAGDHEAVLDDLFETLAGLAPEIRASLPGRRVKSDETNPSGETRLEADAYADELIEDALREVDGIGTYASEEQAEPIDIGDGELSVACDPLDGSSNIKPNSPMGTIVAVYEGDLPGDGDSLVRCGVRPFRPDSHDERRPRRPALRGQRQRRRDRRDRRRRDAARGADRLRDGWSCPRLD
jgi:Fructose-1,6-bisphosphatase